MKEKLLSCIELHVPFDGWSEVAFKAAAQDAGITLAEARRLCPRGALDLAVLSHQQGDLRFEALFEPDLTLPLRSLVAAAIKARLELAGDREALRSATSLFALPHRAGEGGKLLWATADSIWRKLGDTAQDGNYYTKRASLAAVYSASLLYWLGDDTGLETEGFIQRRIAEVMALEKAKAHPLFAPLKRALNTIKAPSAQSDLPGRW